jgi:hypothetical protein
LVAARVTLPPAVRLVRVWLSVVRCVEEERAELPPPSMLTATEGCFLWVGEGESDGPSDEKEGSAGVGEEEETAL